MNAMGLVFKTLAKNLQNKMFGRKLIHENQGERWSFPHQAPGRWAGNSPNDGFGCFVGSHSPEMHRILQFMIREFPQIEYTKYSNSSVVWELLRIICPALF